MDAGGKLEQARRYLAENTRLRSELGVAAGEELACEPLGAGEHNDNYVFCVPGAASRCVLRVCAAPQPFHADQVAYEEAALRALAPSGRTPRVLYRDSSPSAPGFGVLVISFCAGQMLDFDALRPGDLRCAAKILADVHAVRVEGDCPLHRPADPLRELFGECMKRYEAYLRSGFADARISSRAERLVERARALADAAPAPAAPARIVNTEPLASHFLIPRESAAAAAAAGPSSPFRGDPGSFIDWERPVLGEPAQDLAYFTALTTTFWDSSRLFSAREEADFIEAYWREADGRVERDGFDERYPAWRALTLLRSTTWCCRAWGQCGGEPARHPSEKAREKLSAYLSDAFFERILPA